jgi:hypothetical protein
MEKENALMFPVVAFDFVNIFTYFNTCNMKSSFDEP